MGHGAVVAEHHTGVFGQVVGGTGKLRVDEAAVAVGGRERDAVFQPLQVPLQRGDQRRVGLLTPLLAGNQRLQVLHQTGQPLRV